MILLKIHADNIFMFDNFTYDLTFKKKIINSTIPNEYILDYPNIRIKKANVLMGANASGKTTLGKLLCLIYNYINGRDISRFLVYDLKDLIFNKSSNSEFSVEFIIEETIYLLEVKFNSKKIISEKLFSCNIRKNDYINILRKRLYDSQPKEYANNLPAYSSLVLQKYILRSENDIFNLTYLEHIKSKSSYLFTFSDYNDEVTTDELKKRTVDIDFMSKILSIIDNSIKNVEMVNPEKDDSFYINFKNGESTIVPNGIPEKIDKSRISHGTCEAIRFVYILDLIKNNTGLFFIDELMSHMHTELETLLLNLLISNLNNETQIIYTTHNEDCLDLILPIHSFSFLRRGNNMNNEIIYPELTFNKNDRKLRYLVKNDYFKTIPQLDKIYEYL